MSDAQRDGVQLRNVTIERGGFPVVHDLDLTVPIGEATVLLGRNGAGKTTILEAISGVVDIASGEIDYLGASIIKRDRPSRAKLGIGHVEQGRRIFSGMTVEDNIEVARRGDWGIDETYALFPELKPRGRIAAGLLSGGEQQMLVIARALAAKPRLLMLDELSLGLAPIVANRLVSAVRALVDDTGIGILLVEQYAPLALSVGDTAHVLKEGRLVYQGSASGLTADALRSAYLEVPAANG